MGIVVPYATSTIMLDSKSGLLHNKNNRQKEICLKSMQSSTCFTINSNLHLVAVIKLAASNVCFCKFVKSKCGERFYDIVFSDKVQFGRSV